MRGTHPAHGPTLASRLQLHGVTGLFELILMAQILSLSTDVAGMGIQLLLPQDSNSTTTSLQTAIVIQSLVTLPEAIITTAQFI